MDKRFTECRHLTPRSEHRFHAVLHRVRQIDFRTENGADTDF